MYLTDLCLVQGPLQIVASVNISQGKRFVPSYFVELSSANMDLGPQRSSLSLLPAYLLLFILINYCHASALSSFAKPHFLENSLREKLCTTASCQDCSTACPSSSELAKENTYCRQVQPVLKQSSLNNAYINCTKNICEKVQRKNACGLIDVNHRYTVTSQVDAEIKRTWARVRSLRIQKRKFDEDNPLNPRIILYYEHALNKIQQCKSMFRSALSARAHNFKLKEYLKSLQYRRVTQEVTRFKFENEDLHRHLKFWEKQHKTLTLAVRTSPEGLKDARDALFSEMLSYEADAALITMLQNASLTKDERAELVIKLRENVQGEIDLTRTQYAHLLREEQFIKSARMEIFFMLRDVLLKLRSGIIQVHCGGDMLSDIVGEAITTAEK